MKGPEIHQMDVQECDYFSGSMGSSKKTDISRLAHLRKLILPSFITEHMDGASLCTVLRTQLAHSLVLILLVQPQVRTFLGVSGYLALVLSSIEVSGGYSASASGISSFFSLFFAAMGYAVGVACNAINWRIRRSPAPQLLIENLLETGVCRPSSSSAEMEACFMATANRGHYLTLSTTALSVCLLLLYTFLMGLLRSIFPRISFATFLSSAVAMASVTYLNFLPIFLPEMVGLQLMVPIVVAFLIRIVMCLSIAPCSSNSKVTSMLTNAVNEIGSIIQNSFCDIKLHETKAAELRASVEAVEDAVDAASLDLFYSKFEISYSRFTSEDLHDLQEKVKTLIDSLWLLSKMMEDTSIPISAVERQLHPLQLKFIAIVEILSFSSHYKKYHGHERPSVNSEKNSVFTLGAYHLFDIVEKLNIFMSERTERWVFPSFQFMFSRYKIPRNERKSGIHRWTISHEIVSVDHGEPTRTLCRAAQVFHRDLMRISPYALYAAKQAVVSIAMLTPYFCRPSAYLSYRYRLVWASILTLSLIRFRNRQCLGILTTSEFDRFGLWYFLCRLVYFTGKCMGFLFYIFIGIPRLRISSSFL